MPNRWGGKQGVYCRLHRWEFVKRCAALGRIWKCRVCRKEQYERES